MLEFDLGLAKEALNTRNRDNWEKQIQAIPPAFYRQPNEVMTLWKEMLNTKDLKKSYFQDFVSVLSPLQRQYLHEYRMRGYHPPFRSLLEGALNYRHKVELELLLPEISHLYQREVDAIVLGKKPQMWLNFVCDHLKKGASKSIDWRKQFYNAAQNDDIKLSDLLLKKAGISAETVLADKGLLSNGNPNFRVYDHLWRQAYEKNPKMLDYFHDKDVDPFHEWVRECIKGYRNVMERQLEKWGELPGFSNCLTWKNSKKQDALGVALYLDHTRLVRRFLKIGLTLPILEEDQSLEDYRVQHMPQAKIRQRSMGFSEIDITDEEIVATQHHHLLHRQTPNVQRRNSSYRL